MDRPIDPAALLLDRERMIERDLALQDAWRESPGDRQNGDAFFNNSQKAKSAMLDGIRHCPEPLHAFGIVVAALDIAWTYLVVPAQTESQRDPKFFAELAQSVAKEHDALPMLGVGERLARGRGE